MARSRDLWLNRRSRVEGQVDEIRRPKTGFGSPHERRVDAISPGEGGGKRQSVDIYEVSIDQRFDA